MQVSNERVQQIYQYKLENGIDKTIQHFNLTLGTLNRYLHYANPKRKVYEVLKPTKVNYENRNTLVIADLHEPFTLNGYLDFCIRIYEKYKCNTVVFIGDIIDNHYSSFHETNPDGHSAGMELQLAKENIKLWYAAFPYARVCIGNHDLIPERKTFTAGNSKTWLKTISEVLNTPNWDYAENHVIDNVMYTHGTARKARQRMRQDLISIVQGHYHSESYIDYIAGSHYLLFCMQVGAGLDKDSYAAAYGRHFSKPHVNCGVVLEGGRLPILEYMEL